MSIGQAEESKKNQKHVKIGGVVKIFTFNPEISLYENN